MMTQEKMNKDDIYNKIRNTKYKSNSAVGAALKAALLGKKMKGSNKIPKKVKSGINENRKKIEKSTVKSNLYKNKNFDKTNLGENINGVKDADKRVIIGLEYILNYIDLYLQKDAKESVKKVNTALKKFKILNDFEMKNGIYSAVVKEIDKQKTVVSIGNIVLDDKTIGNNGIVSLDYTIKSKYINGSLDLGDELFISLSLDDENSRFNISEFKLTLGNKYFMVVNNVTDKGIFVKTGIYSSFISKDMLKWSGYDNKFKKGDKVLVELKSINEDKKQKYKKRLNVSLVSKAYQGKGFPTFDFVKNRKSLDKSFYKVEEQKKNIKKQTKPKNNSKKPQSKQDKNKKIENKKIDKSKVEVKNVEGKDVNVLAA